ncbi:hypothetical protein [Treponema denticola]|uniref:hypothetical protein n=1 Tax=Treponema denticola TaxID=158 RepID=UPI0021058111|nr:hypothetical protein [Treponema denticola]UTY22806.1 hypothetical protein E4N78_00435 [Treponema denticola]
MKKNFLVVAVLFTSIAFLTVGCTTTDLTTNKTGWSDYAEISVKDFEPVGIVRVTSKEVFKVGPFRFSKSSTGSKVTYDMLIAEAKKLGAHDIINVRIDVANKSSSSIFDYFTGSTKEVEYIGTALAIKYKNPPEQAGRHPGAKLGDSEMLRSSDASSVIKSLFGGK